jgi:membrane protein involved in colicin uptake
MAGRGQGVPPVVPGVLPDPDRERLAHAAEHATQEAAAERDAAAGQPAGALEGAGGTGSAGAALVPFLAAHRQAVDNAVDEMFGDNLRRGRSVRLR